MNILLSILGTISALSVLLFFFFLCVVVVLLIEQSLEDTCLTGRMIFRWAPNSGILIGR
jgi:hypothetical protein